MIGAIIVEEAGDAVLNYEYANEPRAHAIDGMHAHRGTARLRLNCESQVLEGEYYTGRDRKSHGTLRLERLAPPNNMIGRAREPSEPSYRHSSVSRTRIGD